MKVCECIASTLDEQGVKHMFGLMGDGNLRLLNYWSSELGASYYGTRNESAAVAMADGYARASGNVGVCTVTQGPGVTNTLTALVSARKARTPLLLLVGDVSSMQQGWPQDVDHDAFFAAAEVPVVHISDAKTPRQDVVRAYRLAISRRGPVAINMPTDVQDQDWIAWDDEPDELVPQLQPCPDQAQISAAVDALTAARRPVIIAGHGAVVSNCSSALRNLGHQLGALLATSLRGKGLFDGDPYSVGIAGGLGSNLGVKLIGEADVVLVVGAGLNDFTTMRRCLLPASALVIRIDVDSEVRRGHDGDVAFLAGDAAQTVASITAELAARGGPPLTGYRTESMAADLRDYDPRTEFVRCEEPGLIDPRSLAISLNDSLPDNRLIVTDAGHFFGYPVAYVDAPDGRSFLCGIDFGSIGLGIGLAMGAAVAQPDRQVVLFIGDGGLLMNLGELETLVRYEFGILIVVFNDAAYGSELQILRLWNLPEQLSVFPPTDLAAVTRTLGGRAERLTDEPAVISALDELKSGKGPLLLDCVISQTVRAAWLEEAFRR